MRGDFSPGDHPSHQTMRLLGFGLGRVGQRKQRPAVFVRNGKPPAAILALHGPELAILIRQKPAQMRSTAGKEFHWFSASSSHRIAPNYGTFAQPGFGRRWHHERRLLLRRPASKKRQGTKSRGSWVAAGQRALWGFDASGEFAGDEAV